MMKSLFDQFEIIRKLKKGTELRYGKGYIGVLKFIYYSLFSMNTFIVYFYDCPKKPWPTDFLSKLKIERRVYENLHKIRSRLLLSKEFYVDQTYDAKDFFLSYWEGNPAYIHWIFYAGAQTRFLDIGDKCSEISYMLTLPEYRGKGICSQTLDYTVGTLFDEGVRRVFCVVHEKNVASIKAVEKSAFQVFGRMKSIGPLNLRKKVTCV